MDASQFRSSLDWLATEYAAKACPDWFAALAHDRSGQEVVDRIDDLGGLRLHNVDEWESYSEDLRDLVRRTPPHLW